MKKVPDGEWVPIPHPREVIEELLPWGLRDFFVMDADKAADFVGGSENKVIARREVITKTTRAVQSLLGIDVFKLASGRVERLRRDFGSEATKAIGDEDLNVLQGDLEECRRQKTGLERDLAGRRRQRVELADNLRRAQDTLETEVKGVGAAEQLSERLSETRRRRGRASVRYGTTMLRLAWPVGVDQSSGDSGRTDGQEGSWGLEAPSRFRSNSPQASSVRPRTLGGRHLRVRPGSLDERCSPSAP